VEYTDNAPVNIDGGPGTDTVVVIGTEFSDTFVITRDGVYGAGLFIRFVGIEVLEVDGMEGTTASSCVDQPTLTTTIFGGLGKRHVRRGRRDLGWSDRGAGQGPSGPQRSDPAFC